MKRNGNTVRRTPNAGFVLLVCAALLLLSLAPAVWAREANADDGEATPPPEDESTPQPGDPPPPVVDEPAVPAIGETTPPKEEELPPPPEEELPPPGEGEEVVVATPVEPPKPFVRHASFLLAPTFAVPLVEETRDALGYLYGGTLGFKYHVIPWLAVSLRSGYLMGFAKEDVSLGYVDYRRIVSTTAMPILMGVHAEALPRYRINPFVGLFAGGMLVSLQMEPEDIDSPIPVSHDELTVSKQEWLTTYGGEVGLDVRITDWVGAFIAGRYHFASAVEYDLKIPRASRESRLEMSQGEAAVGICVYY